MKLEYSTAFLDKPEITSILFYPRSYYLRSTENQEVISLQIPVDNNIFIDGKIYRSPEVNTAVILYFHGNGETVSDYDSIAPYYTKVGLTLFVVDYRGYGLSNGDPTATSLISDAMTIYNQVNYLLKQQNITYSGIFVMGRSLGSAAAIEVAYQASEGVSGLIVESGFAYTFDLLHRLSSFSFLPIPDTIIDEGDSGFQNLSKIRKITTPCLFIHGRKDSVIPITDALALQRACKSQYKPLMIVPQADHNSLFTHGLLSYFHSIHRFVYDTISKKVYNTS